MVKYCSWWNLKFNFKKTKILVIKKGGKLKKETECMNELPNNRSSRYNKLFKSNLRKYMRKQ